MLNLLTLLLPQPPATLPQPTPTPVTPADSTTSQISATPMPTPVAAPESWAVAAINPLVPASAQVLRDQPLRLDSQHTLPSWNKQGDRASELKTEDKSQLSQPGGQAELSAVAGQEAPTSPPTLTVVEPPTLSLKSESVQARSSNQPTLVVVEASPISSPPVRRSGSNRLVKAPRELVPDTQAQSDDGLANKKRDRRKVIESRLAEIVARDRIAKDPRFQETQITTAIDYANQGQFEQARKIIQTIAVSPQIRSNVLNKIADLEVENAKPTPVRGTAQARRIVEMSKLPKPRFFKGQVESRGASRDQARSAAPKSLRNSDFGIVNLRGSQDLAYNRNLSPSRLNNGDLQIVYPLPVPAPITSSFGWRVHPISGSRRFHSGTDIGAAQGTPVLAAYSGRVKGADYMGGYGLAIVIEHKDGTLDTLYAHLSQVTVRPGEWVEQGSMIGEVGSTGASTGPHLHFEIRKLASKGWATLDPGPQLKQAREQLVKVRTYS